MDASGSELALPEPSRLGEVLWLEPYPDALLDELPDAGDVSCFARLRAASRAAIVCLI
jgi:hypothetical protein